MLRPPEAKTWARSGTSHGAIGKTPAGAIQPTIEQGRRISRTRAGAAESCGLLPSSMRNLAVDIVDLRLAVFSREEVLVISPCGALASEACRWGAFRTVVAQNPQSLLITDKATRRALGNGAGLGEVVDLDAAFTPEDEAHEPFAALPADLLRTPTFGSFAREAALNELREERLSAPGIDEMGEDLLIFDLEGVLQKCAPRDDPFAEIPQAIGLHEGAEEPADAPEVDLRQREAIGGGLARDGDVFKAATPGSGVAGDAIGSGQAQFSRRLQALRYPGVCGVRL